MGNDNKYQDWKLDTLIKTSEELGNKLHEALKETNVNANDLWELTEMERELTRREI